ncbi:MAG: PTS lactose/cellobiose transporter subunit IIA [Clostridium sp.]|uniref:Lichenan-specific phosphotransferase enzyme IIA component n=1 Tax=Clostridium paraputrificum TaxID=29363 RepID=A0A6N3EA37_9CLOT|nr:PTS lactose/cellobiose transporter subunit IIA [Clostridium sp.]MBS5927613.1 PTS lactose/cellobiose transporter subunit IIA [Clostridium sp.]MBS5987374.1 PTS lactose/cellobiose transporter subunit IIA [Clostridium sp.]
MDYQEIIFGLIVNAGDSRSNSMKAIRLAKKGKIEEAKETIKISEDCLNKAHEIQTSLIQDEAAGKRAEVTLLMVHAQDHLMNAITIKDIAIELIDTREELESIKNIIK